MSVGSSQLVRYDAMVLAIAECHRVDETLQIHTQAAALEAAARVAMDTEAERRCVEIRIRAERRWGQLAAELKRASKAESGAIGGDIKARNLARPAAGPATEDTSRSGTQPKSEYAVALDRSKVPKQTAHRWQQLAKVPEDRFEAHLAAEEKPSARAIVESVKAKPQMSEEALWLWGRLRDFERKGFLDVDPSPLVEQMTAEMRDDVLRLAPLVASLLRRCNEKEMA